MLRLFTQRNRISEPDSERGSTAVELALLLPILVTLVLGTVEGARMYHAWETLTHAAREAARPLALGSGDPVTTARDNVPGLVAADVTVATYARRR